MDNSLTPIPQILSPENFDGETFWATQAQIAAEFETTKQNVSLHLRNAFAEKELDEKTVVKETLITAADGKKYPTKLYNLDAMIAVGYRVNSAAGTRFRIHATQILNSYLTKGLVVNPALQKTSPLQLARQMLEALEQQQQQLDSHAERITSLEAHVQSDVEYFTVIGYFRKQGLPPPTLNEAQSIGQRATRLSRARSYGIGKTTDPRYGEINTYHEDILKEIVGR